MPRRHLIPSWALAAIALAAFVALVLLPAPAHAAVLGDASPDAGDPFVLVCTLLAIIASALALIPLASLGRDEPRRVELLHVRPVVEPGARVTAGQVIGYTSSSPDGATRAGDRTHPPSRQDPPR